MVVFEETHKKKQKRGELSFPVDKMHGGIRAAVMGTFFGAGVVGFIGGVVILPNAIPIAAITGLVFAAGGSYGIEKYLKERWPSGRELVADAERIAMEKHGEVESSVDCTGHVNVLAWHFKVKKDSPRAKKGWHVVALGLEQDDNHIIVYSVASPEDFEDMPLASSFTKLERKKDKSKGKGKNKSVASIRDAGEQRRLQTAEFVRGMEGGDISFEQFSDYILFLQANYPEWMIS